VIRNEGDKQMLNVTIPDTLSLKINELAGLACQTPEQFIIELLEKLVELDGGYKETAYLAESAENKKRLNRAVADIHQGKYEFHGLSADYTDSKNP
jgi:hypothetical protein